MRFNVYVVKFVRVPDFVKLHAIVENVENNHYTLRNIT